MELAQTVELGAGALDLRDALKALPHGPPQGKTRFRESPVLQIALLQMQSGCPLDVAATAYVSLTYFGDPSRLLQEAAKAERPLLKRIADPCLDPCRHCADSDAAQQHALPRTSFAEPDSEQPPDSDYNTCEVPSYLYNSWSPEARCPSESPSGCRVSPDPWTPQQSAPRSGHFAWPGLGVCASEIRKSRVCQLRFHLILVTVLHSGEQEPRGAAMPRHSAPPG